MTATSEKKIRVFISYSHDSEEHKVFVLNLANRLRTDGLECYVDQYINGSPSEGWRRWMVNQIKKANFVLIICTKIYLERYEGNSIHTTQGKGVNFEGLIIEQTLYEKYYVNDKFIPIIADNENYEHVPITLRDFKTYKIYQEYIDLYRYLTKQPKIIPSKIRENIIKLNPLSGEPLIRYGDLPTVDGNFFGRYDELNLLNKEFIEGHYKIIEFVAAGGTGKTKLLRQWLNESQDRIGNYFIWSFYSQGSYDDKYISAATFFSYALKRLGSDKTSFNFEEEKADDLADLLIKYKVLLILDGIEPLQYAGKGMEGRLKDKALTRLLKKLAVEHSSLCIITTRLSVYDFKGISNIYSYTLDNLKLEEGVRLLRSLKVKGSDEELEKAVSEYNNHALSLHLLGTAIVYHLDGNISQRSYLDELIDNNSEIGRQAFRVMQAYEYWLRDTPELNLLYLLSMFNQPIKLEILEVLWEEKIHNFTEGISDKAWRAAMYKLIEEYHLLFNHKSLSGNLTIDCHPLIREYFSKQLRYKHSDIWGQAHKRLYEYYKNQQTKYLPDSLEEIQPLINAIEHGCLAGLHQQAFDEIYWDRIAQAQHGDDRKYILSKIGASGTDLEIITHFFTIIWNQPIPSLQTYTKAKILRSAGYSLRTLGRIRECIEAFEAAQIYWKILNISKDHDLVEPYLTYGQVEKALDTAKIAVERQDNKTKDRIDCESSYARALHQSGKKSKALNILKNIEKNHLTKYKYLIRRAGFFYNEILLEKEIYEEVELRAKYTIKNDENSILYKGLNYLFLAIVDYKFYKNTKKAFTGLKKSLNFLRESGNQDHIPRALLVQALVYRELKDFENSYKSLREVYDIAEPHEMRLHLTDYYLEMTRTLIAEQKMVEAKDQIEKAAQLIKETGYHRRDYELAKLQKILKTN